MRKNTEDNYNYYWLGMGIWNVDTVNWNLFYIKVPKGVTGFQFLHKHVEYTAYLGGNVYFVLTLTKAN